MFKKQNPEHEPQDTLPARARAVGEWMSGFAEDHGQEWFVTLQEGPLQTQQNQGFDVGPARMLRNRITDENTFGQNISPLHITVRKEGTAGQLTFTKVNEPSQLRVFEMDFNSGQTIVRDASARELSRSEGASIDFICALEDAQKTYAEMTNQAAQFTAQATSRWRKGSRNK